MDHIVVLIPFLLFCVMAAKILAKSIGKNSTLKLPPGPNPLPIIGNMHQLLGSQPFHHLLRDLAGVYGPLMHLKLGVNSTIVVTSPEMAKEIYKTHDLLFASRPLHLSFRIASYNFIDIIFGPHGNHWRQLRKICTMELLSPKRVQTFRSVREDEVLKLIKSISSQKGSIVNLTRAIFSLIYGITSRAAFGKRSQHTERYLELVEEMNHLGSGFCLADMYPSVKLLEVMIPMRYKMERAQKRIDDIVNNILIEHKAEKLREATGEDGAEANGDLVDVLLNIQQKGEFQPQLTDTCIKAVIFVSQEQPQQFFHIYAN